MNTKTTFDNTMMSDSSVFIIENINEGLTINRDESNDFFLSGIAAKFGVKNNNNRVYEAKEYLPHLEYLNEKIARKQLFGEMDHPQNYDVTLKNVSHIIEGLSFDPQDNTVKIKVRLLDTPCGRIAKTLVEAGCTVSISSRAAGQVNEGNVKLQKIFTYDLVAEPGFSEAMLKRGLNESVDHTLENINESYSKYLQSDSVLNKLTDISESYNFTENVKIYKLNNPSKIQENNNQEMSEFVTKTDFQRYSTSLKKKFTSLSENVREISSTNEADIDVNKLASYTNYLAEELKTTIKYTNYLAGLVENNIGYTQHVAETTNNAIEFSDYLSERLSQNINYSEYLGEKVNQGLNYSEYLSEQITKGLQYSEYLGETLNQGLNYSSYLGDKLNQNIAFSDYISEQVNNVIDFSDYLSENLSRSIKFSDYLGENLDKNIQYADYLAEGLNESIGTPVKKMKTDVDNINESANITVVTKVGETSSIDEIASAVSQLAMTIKSKSAGAVLENQYPFLKLMNESNKKMFLELDSQTKTDVIKVLGSAVWTNEAEIVHLMSAVVNKLNENVPSYIRYMPAQYKEIFESMTEPEKNRIASQANMVQLNTTYQIKSFWDTRDLKGVKERIYENTNINKIQQQVNESQSKEGYVSIQSVQDKQRGYSLDYVNRIGRLAAK